MKAVVFPGQGSQFSGMGRDLYDNFSLAKELFAVADEICGFSISKLMFEGNDEELKQTNVTQPSVYIHSVIAFKTKYSDKPDAVAGHSLGEFSALAANGTLTFEDGLNLVIARAEAMQSACEETPSTMAAILGLDDVKVETLCIEATTLTGETVVPANYNCPGQIVISGSFSAVNKAIELLKAAGAKRALLLPVSGAFHSPFMEPAKKALSLTIDEINFSVPFCPVFQNVNSKPTSHPETIKKNLISQLTSPVLWTQSVREMASFGITYFTESGPGKVLQGLIQKIEKNVSVAGIS